MEHSGWNALSTQKTVDITPVHCSQLYYKKVGLYKKERMGYGGKNFSLKCEIRGTYLVAQL